MLADLGRLLAEQDVDHLAGAELLPPLALQPEHRRQQLLRGDRAVPRLRRGQARVAVAARAGLLAEVAEQLDRGGTRPSRTAPAWRPGGRPAAAVRVVALGGVDQLALLHDVLQAVGQPGGGRQPVPPGPAGLLVVALDGPGQVEVGDEAHVGLVDAHAERDRGDHDQAVLAQEARLVGGPGARVEARVVRQRLDPAAAPGTRRSPPPTPGTGSRRCPRRPACSARSSSSSCRLGSFFGTIRYWMFGRSKLATNCRAPVEVQPGRDLGVRRLGGGRGQRDAGHRRPALVQRGQREVVGPEVVPPLGHAVRLVDGEQRDRAAVEQPQRRLGAQPLRRQVEQVELAGERRRPRPGAARPDPASSSGTRPARRARAARPPGPASAR